MQSTIIQEQQKSLTKEQKEAIGLLSIGTFLEYFDMLLYVHMAVLLNELFFPKNDSFTSSLLAAGAFSSTYLLRPFAAIIFGWIGDNIGRKSTVIITTALMSFSCLVMANLPTYQQIGIAAAWIMTICRIIQGMSSMGEIVGAEVYLTEMVKLPLRNFAVSLIVIFASLGGVAALAIASLVTSYGFNWRIAFWFGAGIAIVGAVARTALRETGDFINAKKRMKETITRANINSEQLESGAIWQEKINKKTMLALFLIECTGPTWFCIVYMYCGNILKDIFHYNASEVIHQNFVVSIIDIIALAIIVFLVRKIHPLKILIVKAVIFLGLVILLPILLDNIISPWCIFFLQIGIIIFAPVGYPAYAVFYSHFPILKRFTSTAFTFAISRSLMYPLSSFGLIYLGNYFGHYGLLFFIIPTLIIFILGLMHFIKLEKAAGNYH